ncbi:MAG: sterol desaturase family protein [Polyangiaceae bacterium]
MEAHLTEVQVLAVALVAVPITMLAEEVVSRRKGEARGPVGWRRSNLACGLLRLATAIPSAAVVTAVYTLVHRVSMPLHLVGGLGAVSLGLLGFLAYDFLWYWSHRASHRHPLLWATHAVHHQAERYDMSLNLRLGMLTALTQLPFDLPLALLGVPPTVFLAIKAIHAASLFWLHSKHLGDLGPLGFIFNTPSFHRVHHSRDEAHHHVNFGGVLIVFDRLFGTFVPEPATRLRYGVEGFEERSALKANLVPLVAWWLRRRARSVRGKLTSQLRA